MAKLSSRAQWMILLGGYFGYNFLANAAQQNPGIAPFVLPFLILYIAFAVMTWIASPLFNLLLRLDRNWAGWPLVHQSDSTSELGGQLGFCLVFFR